MPFADKGTSTQPVKRFSEFQIDSPWRMRTSLGISCSLSKDGFRSLHSNRIRLRSVGKPAVAKPVGGFQGHEPTLSNPRAHLAGAANMAHASRRSHRKTE